MRDNSILTAALGYAHAGWPVFLLGRNKRPLANCSACPKERQPGAHNPQACRCLTCHGFYAATRDPRASGACSRSNHAGCWPSAPVPPPA